MCKLCLPGPRKGREKGASQGGRKAKGRWGQSMFVMARIANENKEWLLAFLAVGCRWFCACVSMLNRLPSLKLLGFWCFAWVARVVWLTCGRSQPPFELLLLFFVRAFDLNRHLMHPDVQSVSCRPQKRLRKRSQSRKWKSQRQMGSKHVGNDHNGSLRFWLWVAGGFIFFWFFWMLISSLSFSLK